jgi:CheY-like chemotaxis protein
MAGQSISHFTSPPTLSTLLFLSCSFFSSDLDWAWPFLDSLWSVFPPALLDTMVNCSLSFLVFFLQRTMNGNISVTSVPGVGTTFYTTVRCVGTDDLEEHRSNQTAPRCPIRPDSSDGTHTENSSSTESSLKRVLVVDDNETNLKVMAKMLETLGCCADFARDGEEVLFLTVLASLFSRS